LRKIREIGSEFSLPTKYLRKVDTNQFETYSNYQAKVFLSSGRGALGLLAKTLRLNKDDEVLLPSYLCKEIITPFSNELFKIKFYKINEALDVDVYDIMKKIGKNTRALLFINYFGFPQRMMQEIKDLCEGKIVLIEDLVQSFLTQSDEKALGFIGDVTISSYRKWIPIPDGALLGVNNSLLHIALEQVLPYKKLYVETRLHGLELKGEYLIQAKTSKKGFRKLFASAEKTLDSTPVEMSDYSRKMLSKFDFKAIIDKRRENFQYLLSSLRDLRSAKPLYRKLPTGVCPLGFPIITKDRDGLKKMLIKNQIYPPIHWRLLNSIDKKEFSASWYISKHILTIPLDQRYSKEDMQFVADVINRFEVAP
jgi:dTDP-4-amino-4,6-dideoxygalactose transaminase